MNSRPSWRLPASLAIGLVAVVCALVAAGRGAGLSGPVAYVHPPPVIAPIADAKAEAPPESGEPLRKPAAVAARSASTVTILVVGLGLGEAATRAAIGLPAEVALAFSPYGARTVEWQREAREAGHEVLVELPVEPADPARADAGPQVIRVAGTADTQIRALDWVLERASDPKGLLISAGAFAAAPNALAPVLNLLAGRGLVVVEVGGDHLAGTAAAAGAAHLGAAGPLDRDPQPDAIDTALREAEAAARRAGRAVAFVRAYPVSLSRVAAWSASLDATGTRLARLGDVLGRMEAVEGGRP